MKCLECSRVMRRVNEKYHFTESGLDDVYLLGIHVFKCELGHVKAKISKMKNLLEAIAETIVNKPTTLTGKEVRFLRKHSGISASNFARMLGIELSTLSRWENGKQKIGSVADRLIRLCYAGMSDYKNVQEIVRDFVSLRELVNVASATRIEVRPSPREGYHAIYPGVRVRSSIHKAAIR